MLKYIQENLELPTKPKRPVTVFFRFFDEVRRAVKENNPKMSSRQITSLITKIWKTMDDKDKEKYVRQYNDEKQRYMVDINNYNKMITDDDKKELPAKPKRPVSPFMRFYYEMRHSVKVNNPDLNGKQITSIIEKMWNATDDKEKYLKQHNDEKLQYTIDINNYNKTLTDDDKSKIKETRANKRKNDLSALQTKHKLGKPMKPVNGFIKFLRAQEDFQGQQMVEERKSYYTEIGSKWRALSDAERDKYKPTEETENYL